MTDLINHQLLNSIVDNGHSILSPSGYSGWSKCTGIMKGLSESRANDTDSLASVEGSLAHFLLEICVITWVSPLDVGVTPLNIIIDGKDWMNGILQNPNNSEEVKAFAVKCYTELNTCSFEYEMRLEIEKCYQRITVFRQAGWTILPEMRVSLFNYFGHKHCDGTSDIVMWKGSLFKIVDLKYGKGIEVSPENNGQLQIYAGGGIDYIYQKYGIVFDKIELVIMQPRIGNGVWKVWETSYNELFAFLTKVKAQSVDALLVLTGEQPEVYKPSLSSCMWCHRRKGDQACFSRMLYALQLINECFTFAGVIEGEIKAVDMEKITEKDLSEIMMRTPFITTFLKDMAIEAQARAKKGKEVPNYKIVNGRKQSQWKDKNVNALLNKLVSNGFNHLDCVSIDVKSPAQMNKVKANKEQKKFLYDNIIVTHGSNILVPSSDNRVSVSTNVAEQFKKAGF